MKCHHPVLLLGSPVGNKWKADTPVCISRHTGILYCYRHKILVHILILFSILVHSSIGKACWPIPSYFFCTGTHHYWEGMLTYSKLLFLYWYTSLLGRHADLFQVTSSVLVHSFIGKACWPTPGYFFVQVHSSIGKACWPTPGYFFVQVHSSIGKVCWPTPGYFFVQVHSSIGKACWLTPGYFVQVHSSIGKACWPTPGYFFCTGTQLYWEGMLTYSRLLFLYW